MLERFTVFMTMGEVAKTTNGWKATVVFDGLLVPGDDGLEKVFTVSDSEVEESGERSERCREKAEGLLHFKAVDHLASALEGL